MAHYLYLCRAFRFGLFRRAAISCLFLLFASCKKPGKDNPVRSSAGVWPHRFLVVIRLLEKRGGWIERLYPIPPLSHYPFVLFPACQWICDPALPPATHRLLAASGHRVLRTDRSRRRGLCPGG